MYTNALKLRIKQHLINPNTNTVRNWINQYFAYEKRNIGSLFEEINHVTSFLIEATMTERVYAILNDVTERPSCYCSSLLKFNTFQKGYRKYCCTKCRANDTAWLKAVAETNLARYGTTHVAKLEEERAKRREQMRLARQVPLTSEQIAISNIKRRRTIEARFGKINTGWLPKAVETRVLNGNMIPYDNRAEYLLYYDQVIKVTKKQDLTLLDNFEKRGILGKDDDAHHVDHIFSIYDGFLNNVPPFIIGHISNLQCIPGLTNIQKGNNSWHSLDTLLENYDKWKRA